MNPAVTIKEISIDDIFVDQDIQPRVKCDDDVVRDYRQKLDNGINLPPVRVTFDGRQYTLYGGFHRIMAHKWARLKTITCEVVEGTRDDAAWLALAENKEHGLYRSTKDKRKAVEMALRQRPKSSGRVIADHCGVDHKTVASVRTEMESGGEIPHLESRLGSDGKSYPSGGPKAKEPKTPNPRTADIFAADDGMKEAADKLIASMEAEAQSSADVDAAFEPVPEPEPEQPKQLPVWEVAREVVPVDALGNPIPDLVRDVFGDSALPDKLFDVLQLIEATERILNIQRLKDRSRLLPYLKLSEVAKAFDEALLSLYAARDALLAGKPYVVCKCQGHGCGDCRKAGYLPEWRYEELRTQEDAA